MFANLFEVAKGWIVNRRTDSLRWLLAPFCLLLSTPGLDALDRRPNVVFIIVDDMGWADLGCYGQKGYATPHLDRMAAEGIRFTQAYSGCTVCAPARSTLMTGLHMGHTPVRGNTGGIPLPDRAITVAEVLKKAGYATGGFGKWGLGDLDTEGVPERQGFDVFFGYYHQIHAHYYYPDYLIDTGKKVPLPGNEGFYQAHKGQGGMPAKSQGLTRKFSHSLIKKRMFDWIRANSDRRFFCYAPWTPPHGRYEIPTSDPAWQQVKDRPWPMRARVHAAFDILVDRHVGEVLRLLEELRIDKETVVFFCSDNGSDLRFEGSLDSCGPLSGSKRSMREGGIRVPLIVRWPETIRPGQVSDLPTYFPDVFPTLVDLAGAEQHVPESIDGVSIVPTLLGRRDEQKRHDYMYWEWPMYNWGKRRYSGKLGQAVRHGKWKLIREGEHPTGELYDLSQDIGERRNVAGKHPEIVSRLMSWIDRNRVDPPAQKEPVAPQGKNYR